MHMFKLRPIKKKGTEKPIEIFVALFIILAVAMVMLKMFKGQISEKSNEMKEIQRQSDIEQALTDAKLKCKTACSDVYDQGCTDRAKASYCLQKLNAIDLNGDLKTNSYDITVQPAYGICEDGIFCPMFSDCTKCGNSLDLKECKTILCKYYNSSGIRLPEATLRINTTWNEGTCVSDSPAYMAGRMWPTVVFGGVSQTTGVPGVSNLNCSGIGYGI